MSNNSKTDVILRIKKTTIYMEKMVDNFPKKNIILKERIIDSSYNLLELSYMAISDIENRKLYIKKAIVKMKMIDFYIKTGFDMGIISHKSIKTLGLNLRDITSILNMWIKKNEEIK